MHRLLLLAVVVCLPAPAAGQELRFEVGQRLRQFERVLAAHPGEEARRRALPPLEQATPTFFRGQLAEVAGLLDRARLALPSAAVPADATRWAESLWHRPAARLLDSGTAELTVRTEALYPVAPGRPEKAAVRHTLRSATGMPVATLRHPTDELPVTLRLPLKDMKDGDYLLLSEVLIDGKPAATTTQTVSLAGNLKRRLAALRPPDPAPGNADSRVEATALPRLRTLLTDLAAGRTLETNYPAAQLLAEAEAVSAALTAGKPYYTPARSGQFWLSLNDTAVRLQVPPQAARGKALPLVVALHGAGGSENLFFDGYGDGLVARLCARRGWLLLAPRAPLFSFTGLDLPPLIDALATRFPVDRDRVFLIGHSMGAARAVAAAGKHPERIRAVAALGGGGGFRASEGLQAVRFFVGVGEADFALNGASNLNRQLVKAGVKQVVFKTYPAIEHLMVVQHALPEVFAFLDEAARTR